MLEHRTALTGIMLFALLANAAPASAQLADTPWPKYQHDRRNSGCSPHVGPEAPTVRWWSDVVGQPLGAGVVIGTRGELYMAWLPNLPGGRPPAPQADPGCLERLERNGRWTWNRGLIEWGGPHSTPLVAVDGTVFVVDGASGFHNGSRAYTFDPQGRLRWSTEPHYPGMALAHAAIGLDGAYIVPFEDELVSLDRQGRTQWSHSGYVALYQCPAVGDDGTIYINLSSKLFALDPVDGSTLWTSQSWMWGGISLAPDGTIYAIEYEIEPREAYFLVAINSDGSRQWRTELDGPPIPQATIAADGSLYISTWPEGGRGRLWAVNSDGQVKWTKPTDPNISSSIVVDGAGNLYYQDWGGVLVSRNAEGVVRWTFDGGRSLATSSPAIDSDGTMYLPAHREGDPDGVMRIVALGPGPNPHLGGIARR